MAPWAEAGPHSPPNPQDPLVRDVVSLSLPKIVCVFHPVSFGLKSNPASAVPWLCGLGANHLTSLGLSFLICEMGTIVPGEVVNVTEGNICEGSATLEMRVSFLSTPFSLTFPLLSCQPLSSPWGRSRQFLTSSHTPHPPALPRG